MRHIDPNFTGLQELAIERVVFALSSCAWKASEYKGFPDTQADEQFLQQEIQRLEEMVSAVRDRVTDDDTFWNRQLGVIEVLIHTFQEELTARTTDNALLSKDKA